MTRARPVACARSTSRAAAPSTQPPLTEPAMRPSALNSRTAPTGRGAEPNVRTTIARPIPRPSACQDEIVASSSLTAPCPSRCDATAVQARPPGAVGPLGAVLGHPGQQLAQPLEAAEVADRDEVVDEGIGGRHPP